MTNLLNPLTLPLHGSRLIEASAGTGKTWTIAALYVRLVLGHGASGQRAPRPLLPAEILVMTFTKAATRELSDRIRRRLVETAAIFRGEAEPHADDAFMQELLAAFPEGSDRKSAAWRLAMAAEAMDDAAVHTIDAWCQRMLREHAFDSGCLFDEELQANEKAMLAQAARDYWRQHVYPLTDEALAMAHDQWPDVDSLLAGAWGLVEQDLPPGAGAGSLSDRLDRLAAERSQTLATLKQGWTDRAAQMQRWLDAQFARKDCPFNKVKIKPTNCTRWIEALVEWAEDAACVVPDVKTGRQRLTPEGLHESLKPGTTIDLPPYFAEYAALMQALESLPRPGPVLRAHAAARIGERLQELKTQAGAFGFLDMLKRLDRALDPAEGLAPNVPGQAEPAMSLGRGDARQASARRLRERILQQHPVALVDEFQDTSPLQLRIFDRLYRIEEGGADDPDSSSTALFLIGDPKQSIYGFRGADIYSYLGARHATRGRHYVLGTNHRSTQPLVRAVNHLFEQAEARPGEGAFLFRAADATADASDALPFVAVAAKGREERFTTSDGDGAAMTLCLDDQLSDKRTNLRLYAELCAERIVTWLNDPQAGFVRPDKPMQRLRPADIAVLVRSGLEAAAVRSALRRRGLPSVYLSDKDSVFQCAEAHDLLRLLRAISAPRDVRLARAALATALFGFSIEELQAIADDDERFDQHCEQLQALHTVWQSQGILAMVRRALHRFDLPARWLAPALAHTPAQGHGSHQSQHQSHPGEPGEGERRLTNVLHLAELLQAAADQLDGEQALVRWFAAQMDAEQDADDTQVLRLESDADLVQIVTVHKSKGLEYPLVFLPFPAQFRSQDRANSGGAALTLPDAEGKLRLVLDPSDEDLLAADKERLREDVRLLYVALTRARHALWIGAAALKLGNSPDCVWHRSAIGALLSGNQPRTPEKMGEDVRSLTVHPDIVVKTLPVDGATGGPGWPARTWLLRREEPIPLSSRPDYNASFERNWSISSYSALVRAPSRAAAGAPDPALADPVSWADLDDLPSALATRVMRDDEPFDDEPGLPLGTAQALGDDALSASVTGNVASAVASGGLLRLAEDPWHRFPRGAFAGNFLHGLLEWLAGERFGIEESSSLQEALAKRCEQQGWGHRSDDVLTWLKVVCTTPLPALGGVALRDLSGTMPEMEFWYPSDGLRTHEVDRLCRAHLLPGRERAALADRVLNGMLMGFADLAFEHGGRYWVLDYKSNALGLDDAAYNAQAMGDSILEHRYDVQAALYQLALHRLLRARLGSAYDPAQHLGGTVFMFLRGVRGPDAGCFVVPAPAALIEALDAMMALPVLELS